MNRAGITIIGILAALPLCLFAEAESAPADATEKRKRAGENVPAKNTGDDENLTENVGEENSEEEENRKKIFNDHQIFIRDFSAFPALRTFPVRKFSLRAPKRENERGNAKGTANGKTFSEAAENENSAEEIFSNAIELSAGTTPFPLAAAASPAPKTRAVQVFAEPSATEIGDADALVKAISAGGNYVLAPDGNFATDTDGLGTFGGNGFLLDGNGATVSGTAAETSPWYDITRSTGHGIVSAEHSATIENTQFSSFLTGANQALFQTVSANGGVFSNAGTLTISGCDFSENIARARVMTLFGGNATGFGGAIYNTGTLNLIDTNFTGNSAEQATLSNKTTLRGGAIYNAGTTNISASAGETVSFSGNKADGTANDIYQTAGATLNISAGTGAKIVFDGGIVSESESVVKIGGNDADGTVSFTAGTTSGGTLSVDSGTVKAENSAQLSALKIILNSGSKFVLDDVGARLEDSFVEVRAGAQFENRGQAASEFLVEGMLAGTGVFNGKISVNAGGNVAASGVSGNVISSSAQNGVIVHAENRNFSLGENGSVNFSVDDSNAGTAIFEINDGGSVNVPAQWNISASGNFAEKIAALSGMQSAALQLTTAANREWFMQDALPPWVSMIEGISAGEKIVAAFGSSLMINGVAYHGFYSDAGKLYIVVPEPSAFALLTGTVAIALIAMRRRRKNSSRERRF